MRGVRRGGAMLDVHDPGRLAAAIEADMARLAAARAAGDVPPALGDLADALARLAAMLRRAEALGQAVTLAGSVARLIAQFRGVVRSLGVPAEA